MRRLLLLIAAACLTAVAAPQNRLPREGSGWAGFAEGSWVRTKQTFQRTGGVPSVTLTTTTLAAVGEKTLTLRHVSENALGVEQATEQVVPRSGEAAEGERAETAEPKRESVDACGRTFSCVRTTTVLTSPAGRREVTVWDSADDALRVQRSVVTYGAQGGEVSRQTLKLTALAREADVGNTTLACLEYELTHEEGGVTQRGKALLSREIPGGTVSQEIDVEQGGQVVLRIVSKAIGFEVK